MSLNPSQEHRAVTPTTKKVRRTPGGNVNRYRGPPFHRVTVDGDDGGITMRKSVEVLKRCTDMRAKYKAIDQGQDEPHGHLPANVSLRIDDGVIMFTGQQTSIVSWEEYSEDILYLLQSMEDNWAHGACKFRLRIIEEKYRLFQLMNAEKETQNNRYHRGGVFCNAVKVDNSVRLSTAMNAKYLVDMIVQAYTEDGDQVVDAQGRTLRQLFEHLEVPNPNELTVENLGLHPGSEKRFHRFDIFDPELNRTGKQGAEILKVFLRRNPINNGKLFADIVRPLLQANDARTHHLQPTEYKIPIFGFNEDEWDSAAKWLHSQHLGNFQNNRWIIQIPRISKIRNLVPNMYKGCDYNQKQIEYLFMPLFNATLFPDDQKYTHIAWMLNQVGGFNIVSDEETREMELPRKRKPPAELPWKTNPPDIYFAYYIWANITSLNCLRKRKGLNTFQFRPTCGEKGPLIDSMIYGYLLADAINHGIEMRSNYFLQYLYGINRVGICMSPLSNNGLYIGYADNPFKTFFQRSMNVTLSTDDPLHYHHGSDPLLEEYGTAQKIFKLSATEISEVARNSVLISSFPHLQKAQWLGEYYQSGAEGNQVELTNVPSPRIEFREEIWKEEQRILQSISKSRASFHTEKLQKTPSAVQLLEEQHNKTQATGGIPKEQQTLDMGTKFPRIIFSGSMDKDDQVSGSGAQLHKALEMRKNYIGKAANPWQSQTVRIEYAFQKNEAFNENDWGYRSVGGVYVLHERHKIPRLPDHISDFDAFIGHLTDIKAIVDGVHVKSFAYRRLELLQHKYHLHHDVNYSNEAGSTEEKTSFNRDFYQAVKVDTHVHMESGMTARQLLDFIVKKAKFNGDDIVSQKEGVEPRTLRQLLEKLDIDPENLTVDALDVQANTGVLKKAAMVYTPTDRNELLTLLLKTDNTMNGRYFAEITKQTFEQFKRERFTYAENRLPIYGMHGNEWDKLSNWFDTHGMACNQNKWMVQIPRCYGYCRKNGHVTSFAQFLEHVFAPLWEVTLHPSKNPRLFHFLNHVSGFDCVDDESKIDTAMEDAKELPEEWTKAENPPFNYYMYHLWANIRMLNEFRQKRNFSTFSFRPHCGESGSLEHLMGCFLVANAISHGVELRQDPVIQYLYYLAQIGIAMSPLSNNAGSVDYLDNPFPQFFKLGLNVSLSTDDPLQFHHTQEPLIEEYSVASKVWKLSPNDMCEIARNSVRQSGFDHAFKQSTIGNFYFLSSSVGNDASKTHLSDIRVAFRYENYHAELNFLEDVASLPFHRAMYTRNEESMLLEKAMMINRTEEHKLEGLITSATEEEDVQRLLQERQGIQKQIDIVSTRLEEIRKQNKKLYDNMAEAMAKEAATASQHARQMSVTSLNPHGSGTSNSASLMGASRVSFVNPFSSSTKDVDQPNAATADEDSKRAFAFPRGSLNASTRSSLGAVQFQQSEGAFESSGALEQSQSTQGPRHSRLLSQTESVWKPSRVSSAGDAHTSKPFGGDAEVAETFEKTRPKDLVASSIPQITPQVLLGTAPHRLPRPRAEPAISRLLNPDDPNGSPSRPQPKPAPRRRLA